MKQNTRDYGKFHSRFRQGFADGGVVDDETRRAVIEQIVPEIAGKAAGDAIGQAVTGAVPGSAPVRRVIGKTVGKLAAPKVAEAVRQKEAVDVRRGHGRAGFGFNNSDSDWSH